MMLTLDKDSYYSPPIVTDALAACLPLNPRAVFDSNCGGGALLATVEREHPDVECAGIDADSGAIGALRIEKPHWTLIPGDSLSVPTWGPLDKIRSRIDLAVLNPPFSMGYAKGLEVDVMGLSLRCSLAMAHVLRTVEQCKPSRVLAVLPESLLASDLDSYGRALLERDYKIEVVSSFRNSTFKGTRANSALVALSFTTDKKLSSHSVNLVNKKTIPKIVRGGLALFKAMPNSFGTPLVHSTDLALLPESVRALPLVVSNGRGVVSGITILLPRVGIPAKVNLRVLVLPRVLLSDCVIAVCFTSKYDANHWLSKFSKNWVSFLGCYNGTGARYITIARLENWMINQI